MAETTTRVSHRFLEVLRKIDRPGTFCASGRLPPVVPGLEVAGVGPIAVPLGKRQATALKKQARQAPYGKGTRTLVDTNVRRVWEIDAGQVTLANPEWSGVVKQAVHEVQSALGLERQKLEPHLYKLLLYEPGGFFLAHRDGEKLDRMVATLVITLPTAHEGGELVVRHEGREVTLSFGPESQFQTQFAGFYADCEHEIRPVTSGFRLSLVYNLTLARSRQQIAAPRSAEHVAAAASVLDRWKSEALRNVERKPEARSRGDGSDDRRPPSKLAVLLDHEYTQAGLTHDALKGVDRAKADVLFAAAELTGCDASLALVTYWESGMAEPSYHDQGYRRHGRYGYRRSRPDWDDESEDSEEDDDDDTDAEYTMIEVYDDSLTAEHFSDAQGTRLAYGKIPVAEREMVAETPLSDGKPSRQDFEGYTGNEGMTLERWYHRAAVMLWPREARFDVLCEAGAESAVGGLQQMVAEWKSAQKSERPALEASCIELAGRIIARWPSRPRGPSGYQDDRREDGAPFLPLLETLGDASLVSAWIRGVLAKDASVEPGETLGDVCQRHGWLTFQDELLEVFEATSNATLERDARLLADWSLRKDRGADRRRLCAELARRMATAVEHWKGEKAEHHWQPRRMDRVALLSRLTQSFIAVNDPDLFDRLVTRVLDRPKDFDFTATQVPALISLEPWLKRNVKKPCPPLRRWLVAVIEELESRVSRPPAKPMDWRRKAVTGCKCVDCQKLARFLDDPETQTLRLPLAEQHRRHLHGVIESKQLDTTHDTERRGRPYVLVCTKTSASYERALAVHLAEVDQLAKVGKLLAWHERLKP